jgi:phage/plasmid-associated DNA primase
VITQTDYGTWRRLALVRFLRTFDGDSADPNLRDRVKREPAIHRAALAWIITGARRWYANDGVTPAAPALVVRDTEDWRVGSDLILGYWRDRLVAEVDVHVMATDMYADFTDWLRSRGQGEWAERTFAERFRDHQETERYHVRHERIHHRPGLRYRNMVISAVPASGKYMAWIGVRFTQASDQQEREPGQGGQGGQGASDGSDSRTGTENRQDHPVHPVQAQQDTIPEQDISGAAEAHCVDCGRSIPAYQVGKRNGRCVRCHYLAGAA